MLATAAGRHLRLWDGDQLLCDFAGHESTITDIGWKPQRAAGPSETVASICYGGVRMWQRGYDAAIRKFDWKGSSLAMAWSPDARYLATGDQDSSVHFWIVKRGIDLQMTGYATKVKELAWDRGSRYLATGGGAIVTVWDCGGKGPERSEPISLERHSDKVNAVQFQPQGSMLASAGEDGALYLWSLDEPDEPLAQAHVASAITFLCWTSDGTRIIIGCADGELRLYDL